MRLARRLRKLEQVTAPEVLPCDCPITTHYELADGTVYPPEVPCLRGRCPDHGRLRNGPERVSSITIACAVPPENGQAPDYPISVDDFRMWDPETGRPRLRVIVWRDESGRLGYHGPPRWYEIEGIEEAKAVRGVGVTEKIEEIVDELRRVDETSPLADFTACSEILIDEVNDS